MAPQTALIEITRERWEAIPDRQAQLTWVDDAFHTYLTEITEIANISVDRYTLHLNTHSRWRRTLIIGTGFVALMNVLAANKDLVTWSRQVLPILAAIVAVIVTVLANLESQANALETAQGYRETRELFLDTARDFDRLWNTHVIPLGDSPDACNNAFELYRQVVEKDKELRSKFKDLTKVKSKQPQ